MIFLKKKIIDTLYGCGLAVLLYRFGKIFKKAEKFLEIGLTEFNYAIYGVPQLAATLRKNGD